MNILHTFVCTLFFFGSLVTLLGIGTGTGFFITADGYFLTNHHVIENGETVAVKVAEKIHPAAVVATDPTNDIAILKVDIKSSAIIRLRLDGTATPGDDAFTVGFPDPGVLGVNPKTTKGSITSLTGIKDDPRFYQTSVQIQPGNSGGPLTDKGGTVIGITTLTLNALNRIRENGYIPQNVNYALKIAYAKPLIDTIAKINLPKDEIKPAADFREAQAIVDRAIGLVIVTHGEVPRASAHSPKADTQKNTPKPLNKNFIFPDSSSRFLSVEEIRRLDQENKWRARNEIYVRHGYIFTTDKGKAFAASFGNLYRPRITHQEVALSAMNRFEQANISLIQSNE